MSAADHIGSTPEGRLLLGLIVESLRFLLQLFEAALGIYIDGILCDLALHQPDVSAPSRKPEVGA
jgi:hypothetical protein